MYKDFVDSMNGFASRLQDDESKRIFEARYRYFIDRDIDELGRALAKEALKYRGTYNCMALNRFYEMHPGKRNANCIVFGAGVAGRCTVRSLKVLGANICGVVDNNFENLKEVEGIKIYSPETLKSRDDNYIVIVAVMNLAQQLNIYYQLLNMKILPENIMMIKEGCVWVDYGKQYFDLSELPVNPDGEIFVDVGCFDGMSSLNAKEWAKGNLNKVYAFEPDKNNLEKCRNRLESLGCEFELYNAASWSSKTTLKFYVNDSFGYASKIKETGTEIVQADSIDHILSGRPVTYIKLDVEGSELETLKGAAESIKKYRPKLAVSLYHKPEDIIELPIFIESLQMDYKYYIRHYQTRWCETTLYAF